MRGGDSTSSSGTKSMMGEAVEEGNEEKKKKVVGNDDDEGGGLRVKTPRAPVAGVRSNAEMRKSNNDDAETKLKEKKEEKEESLRRVVRSVLVANRGECALRMLRTAQRLGLDAYGVFVDGDASHKHVFERNASGRCFEIESYKDADALLSLLRTHQIDMIWPGWGFLAEDGDFARRVGQETKALWVGPTSENIAALGDKHGAKRVARDAGLDALLLPSSPPVRDAAGALAWLDTAGGEAVLPLIVKPVGGGGGIGMHVIRDIDSLYRAAEDPTHDPIRRSCDVAQKYFGGSGDCVLEKYVECARHIEVQIFGNGHGRVIHLGERECSVQRRLQKVVEETPSMLFEGESRSIDNTEEGGSTAAGGGGGGSMMTREELCDAAVTLCAEAKYLSAGTVEFIFDEATARFYLLEVNTRLQVEHGVTEKVNGDIDLCAWMLHQAADFNGCALHGGDTVCSVFADASTFSWKPSGHAIQLRVNAEDVLNDFTGSSGILQSFQFGPAASTATQHEIRGLDIYTSYEAGDVVSTSYDSLLAKLIVAAPTRFRCIETLSTVLTHPETCVAGIESNVDVLRQFIISEEFCRGATLCHGVRSFEAFCAHEYKRCAFEVLDAGLETTVQDTLGRERRGLWRIGVPPSGSFDNFSSKLANALLGNDENAAVLEFLTSRKVALRIMKAGDVCVAGPPDLRVTAIRAGTSSTMLVRPTREQLFATFAMAEGDVLEVEQIPELRHLGTGARGYIGFADGGINTPLYLGSRATFAKGGFGGFRGRRLKRGDVVQLFPSSSVTHGSTKAGVPLDRALWPPYAKPGPATHPSSSASLPCAWTLSVLSGPRNVPDFMTADDCAMLLSATYTVHHDSNRLGIRLGGPKPSWARGDGGEGGSHPSNIHDEEYALGTINFTGDMPIIIAHDGPSLGGFVCPLTIASSDLWKIGQLMAGDEITFKLVSVDEAVVSLLKRKFLLSELIAPPSDVHALYDSVPSGSGAGRWWFASAEEEDSDGNDDSGKMSLTPRPMYSPVIFYRPEGTSGAPEMTVRLAGDRNVLIEYGPMILDIRLRVRVHFLELVLLEQDVDGILETAPGVRTLQVRYDILKLPLPMLIELIVYCDDKIETRSDVRKIKSRIIQLPLAYDSRGCSEAMEKYARSVRSDAPYVPNNLEYIRRNNGIDSPELVKEKILAASYMVLGLGDVYLGACCAVPVNPLHRLITSKMNPARTWTEEGTVGLGGAYMCIYPMYSPGGYQLVGRTLPIWNTFGRTYGNDELGEFFSPSKPWMVRSTSPILRNPSIYLFRLFVS